MATVNTFQTLQTRVQGRIIDLPTFVQGEIPALINEAIDALAAVHNFQCMKNEVQFFTASAATNPHILGQIPTNWKEPRGNPYYVLQQGSTRELDWTPSRQMAYRAFDPFDPNANGPPRVLLIGEAQNATVPDPSNPDLTMTNLNVEVYPNPDGLSDWTAAPAGEYRINVPCWTMLPNLVASGDHNWFTDNATGFILDYATARGFQLDWDEARAQFWFSLAWGPKYDGFSQVLIGGWARKAMNLDKSISYAPARNLRMRRDVYAEPDQWRQ